MYLCKTIINIRVMRKILYGLLVVAFVSFFSLDLNAQVDASDIQTSYYDYETELLGVGQDGTKVFIITVKSKKLDEGVELAKRNAIAACLFKGLEASGQTEKVPAIVPQGITDDNRDFFDDFLKLKDKKGNGGKYLRFVNRVINQESEKIKKGYIISLEIQVSYNALREYMESSGYSKSLNYLF